MNYSDDVKDEIVFNSRDVIKKSRSRLLISELNDMNDNAFLPSSIYTKKEKEEIKKEKETEEDNGIDEGWLAAISSMESPKIKKKSNMKFEGFGEKKKKKKKKKKGNGVTSHKKDFETEMILLQNLQVAQDKFVDTLQKKYDQMENTKSTARGIGKFTTDLITSITTARSLSKDLVKEITNIKKTVADLDFKERKEFGSHSDSEQTNLNNYASTFLKQVMTNGRNTITGTGQNPSEYFVDESDADDLFNTIDENLGESNRSEDVEKYLQYENDGIEVRVIWNDSLPDEDENKFYFVAYNRNGDIVSDYPLPEKTKMSINKSTATATDMYGNKYHMDIMG